MDSTFVKLFGGDAVRHHDAVTTQLVCTADHPVTIILSVVVVLTFGTYIMMLYRHQRTIAEMFKIFTLKEQLYKIIEKNSIALKHLILWSYATGIAAFMTSVLKIEMQTQFIPQNSFTNKQWVAALAVAAAFVLYISIFRYLMIKIIGLLTGQRDFLRRLAIQNDILFTIAVVTTTPFIVLGTTTNNILTNVFATLAVISLIINILIFTKRSLKFFLDKKISIFQWFLYLCGVEIMPLSFVVALFYRG